MLRVNEVNTISRALAAGTMDASEATLRLRAARTLRDPVCERILIPSAALCGGGFAVMFGGGLRESVIALVVAALVQFLSMHMEKRRAQSLMCTLVGAFITTLLPLLFNAFILPIQVDATIAGSLMPLLPGLAMTNAVQDAIRGDMISGLSHGLSALLTAGMIACGALVATGILSLLTGGVL